MTKTKKLMMIVNQVVQKVNQVKKHQLVIMNLKGVFILLV